MNAFLSSLETSCNKFSQCANEKREQLNEIDDEFKVLDKEVKKQIFITKKTMQPRSAVSTATVRTRPVKSRSHKVPRKTATQETVIRPAPYPIKNYVLPAQPVVGPSRFYKGIKRKQIEREEELEMAESMRYPETIPRPRTAIGPDLEIKSKLIYPVKPSKSEIDIYFDKK